MDQWMIYCKVGYLMELVCDITAAKIEWKYNGDLLKTEQDSKLVQIFNKNYSNYIKQFYSVILLFIPSHINLLIQKYFA